MTREEALSRTAFCANDLRHWSRVLGEVAAHLATDADNLSGVCDFLRGAPAEPGLPEVGSEWVCRGSGITGRVWRVFGRRIEEGEVMVGWESSNGFGSWRTLVEFLAQYEPVPAPPAPEPQGQWWYVVRYWRGTRWYRNHHDGNCSNRFHSERIEARELTLGQAAQVIADEVVRGDPADAAYGIEPAGKVKA